MTEARIISLSNQKGGVGKTATTINVAYNLSQLGYHVLCLDLDPQANATQRLLKTAGVSKVNSTLTNVIFNDVPINDATIQIKDNLDLVPTAYDIYMYERYLFRNYTDDHNMVQDLDKRLSEAKHDYDFIFIDTPPAISVMNDNAFWCCTHIVEIMQTEGESYQGTKHFTDYVQNDLINNLDSDVEILAVLPVLMDNNSPLDKQVVRSAKNYYGEENVFNNQIKNMRRVKRTYYTGINGDNDDWDRKTNQAYMAVTKELLERLED